MSDRPIRWSVPPGAGWLTGYAMYLRNQQEMFRQSFSQPSRSVQITLPDGIRVSMVLGPVVDYISISVPQRKPVSSIQGEGREILVAYLDHNPMEYSGPPDPNSFTLLRLGDNLKQVYEEIPKADFVAIVPDNARCKLEAGNRVYKGNTWTSQAYMVEGLWSEGGRFGFVYETQDVMSKVEAATLPSGGYPSGIKIPFLLSDQRVSEERPCYHSFDPNARPFVARGHNYDGPWSWGINIGYPSGPSVPGRERGFVGDRLEMYGLVYLPEGPGYGDRMAKGLERGSLSTAWGHIWNVRQNATRTVYCDRIVVQNTNFFRYLRYRSVDYTLKSFVLVNGVAYIVHEGSIKASASEWHWAGGWLSGTSQWYQPEPEYEREIHELSSTNYRQFGYGDVHGGSGSGGLYPRNAFIGVGIRPHTGVRNLIGLDVHKFVGDFYETGYIFDDDLDEGGWETLASRFRKYDIVHARKNGDFYYGSFNVIDKEWPYQAVYFNDDFKSTDPSRIHFLKGFRKSREAMERS